MRKHRSVIVGCGGRARMHALAYKLIARGELVPGVFARKEGDLFLWCESAEQVLCPLLDMMCVRA